MKNISEIHTSQLCIGGVYMTKHNMSGIHFKKLTQINTEHLEHVCCISVVQSVLKLITMTLCIKSFKRVKASIYKNT